MKQVIDCLIIGHNEMKFDEYEKVIRSMGVDSEAYRDLNLNFIQHNNDSGAESPKTIFTLHS